MTVVSFPRRAISSVWARTRQLAGTAPGRHLLPAAGTVVLGVLGVLFIDWHRAAESVSQADWSWLALACALGAASMVVGGLRWRILLAGAGVQIGRRRTVHAFAFGALANNFLPSGLGGEAARSLLVGRSGERLARTFTSVVADKSTSLACLVALGLLSWAAAPGAVPVRLGLALAIAALGAGLIGLLILAMAKGGVARWSRLPRWLARGLTVGGQVLSEYRRLPRAMLVIVLLGAVFQALTVLVMLSLARALHLDLGFATLAVVVPLVLFATLLPISIGGFGVREGAFVVLLAGLGIHASDAATLSLLSVAAFVVSALAVALACLTPHATGPRAGFPERGVPKDCGL